MQLSYRGIFRYLTLKIVHSKIVQGLSYSIIVYYWLLKAHPTDCLASAGAGDLLRQQNSERMGLERDSLQEETKALSAKMHTNHAERQSVLDEAATQLADKLQGAIEFSSPLLSA